jgi:hypothetical protein
VALVVTNGDARFVAATEGAPTLLRDRAGHFFAVAAGGELPARLAVAGRAALAEATRDGGGRAAALDLLAADALITLALLVTAADDPMQLGRMSQALRTEVTSA